MGLVEKWTELIFGSHHLLGLTFRWGFGRNTMKTGLITS